MSTDTRTIASSLGFAPATVSSLAQKLGINVDQVEDAVLGMKKDVLVLLGNFKGPQAHYLFYFGIAETCQEIDPVLVYELDREPGNLYLTSELAEISARFSENIAVGSQVSQDRLELLGRYFPPTRLEIIYSRFKDRQPDSVENIFQAVLTDMFGDCEDLTLLGDFVNQGQAMDLQIRFGLANNPPAVEESYDDEESGALKDEKIVFDEPVEIPRDPETVYLACHVVVDPALGVAAKELGVGDYIVVKLVDNSEHGLFMAHLLGAVHQREVRPMAVPIERVIPGNDSHPETTFHVRFGPGTMGEVTALPELIISALLKGQMPEVEDPEEYREVYTYKQYQTILMCLGGLGSVLLLLLAYYLVSGRPI